MTSKRSNKAFSVNHLNAWRMHRQWLDRPFTGRSIVDLVKTVGWIYSPGCSTPYLSVRARMPKFRRATLDRLVFKDRKLVQLETLRGCTMLLPRSQAPIALKIRSRTFTELAKQARPLMPITDGEMERLKASVLIALANGPLNHDEILDEVPSSLVRQFPGELRRIGLTGSLWLAINLLKEEGRVLKIQSRKRLDSTEYSFALLGDVLPEVDPYNLQTEQANIELAAQYFRTEGPARVKDFAWWAGVNVTDAMRAAAEVRPRLKSLSVENSKDEFLISEVELEQFSDFAPAKSPQVNFIPYRDIFLKGQREVVSRFVRNEDSDKPFSRWKGKLINDPIATVINNGAVVGVWEWNPSKRGKLDFVLFDPDTPKKVQTLIRKRGTELGGFIEESLGDIRLQGIDYGRHQMTGIRDLKVYWGQGAQVDVAAV
jgi:hypothetical protein